MILNVKSNQPTRTLNQGKPYNQIKSHKSKWNHKNSSEITQNNNVTQNQTKFHKFGKIIQNHVIKKNSPITLCISKITQNQSRITQNSTKQAKSYKTMQNRIKVARLHETKQNHTNSPKKNPHMWGLGKKGFRGLYYLFRR